MSLPRPSFARHRPTFSLIPEDAQKIYAQLPFFQDSVEAESKVEDAAEREHSPIPGVIPPDEVPQRFSLAKRVSFESSVIFVERDGGDASEIIVHNTTILSDLVDTIRFALRAFEAHYRVMDVSGFEKMKETIQSNDVDSKSKLEVVAVLAKYQLKGQESAFALRSRLFCCSSNAKKVKAWHAVCKSIADVKVTDLSEMTDVELNQHFHAVRSEFSRKYVQYLSAQTESNSPVSFLS